MNNFDIDFVVHTKAVLATYPGEYDVSNLLNCTLGLIILPYKNVKGQNHPFWNTEINKVKDLPAFTLHCFEPIRGIQKGKTRYYPKTLEVLLQKIRNGLAHQNIEPITDKKTFKGVIISNYFDETHEDLRIEFSKEELKKFALFIADQYLALAAKRH